MRAFVFWTHTDHFDLVIHSQRRDCPLDTASNPERELQRALEIRVPCHGLLFRTVCVDHNLIVNPLLAVFLKRALRHQLIVATFAPSGQSLIRRAETSTSPWAARKVCQSQDLMTADNVPEHPTIRVGGAVAQPCTITHVDLAALPPP
jgi:hypothetical protein